MGSPPSTQKRSYLGQLTQTCEPTHPAPENERFGTRKVFFYHEFTNFIWQKGVECAIKLIYLPILVISQRSLLGHAPLVIIMIKIRT